MSSSFVALVSFRALILLLVFQILLLSLQLVPDLEWGHFCVGVQLNNQVSTILKTFDRLLMSDPAVHLKLLAYMPCARAENVGRPLLPVRHEDDMLFLSTYSPIEVTPLHIVHGSRAIIEPLPGSLDQSQSCSGMLEGFLASRILAPGQDFPNQVRICFTIALLLFQPCTCYFASRGHLPHSHFNGASTILLQQHHQDGQPTCFCSSSF